MNTYEKEVLMKNAKESAAWMLLFIVGFPYVLSLIVTSFGFFCWAVGLLEFSSMTWLRGAALWSPIFIIGLVVAMKNRKSIIPREKARGPYR